MTHMPVLPMPAAEDTNALLRDLLGKCHATAVMYFERAQSTYVSNIQYTLAATRLIKTSLELVAALEGPKAESVHRIIVEHAPARDVPVLAAPADAPSPSDTATGQRADA